MSRFCATRAPKSMTRHVMSRGMETIEAAPLSRARGAARRGAHAGRGPLQPAGLTAAQAEVIAVLRDADGPLTVREVGDRLVCEGGSPSRLVSTIVAAGLIRAHRASRRSSGGRAVAHVRRTARGPRGRRGGTSGPRLARRRARRARGGRTGPRAPQARRGAAGRRRDRAPTRRHSHCSRRIGTVLAESDATVKRMADQPLWSAWWAATSCSRGAASGLTSSRGSWRGCSGIRTPST